LVVHPRKPRSLSRTLALLLAAAILYAPANLLPILETSSPFGSQRDTIMSGVVYLWTTGSWPLALLIFVASILIPLVKLLALALLLFSVHRRWQRARLQRARLYRLVERVGRWSMTDIFVAAIVSTLVQLRGVATITVGPGAAAFGAVVVLTLLATRAFDPRLIWDRS
jgi:paraquat-inducible protein A